MPKLKKYSVTTTLERGPLAQTSVGEHTLLLDQPVAAGGTDLGPTPVDAFLATIGSCLGTIARLVAHQKKITLEKMEFKVSGEFDVDILLGRSEEGEAGFQSLNVHAVLESPDLDEQGKIGFLKEVDRRCPVSQTVLNGAPVSINLSQELVEA